MYSLGESITIFNSLDIQQDLLDYLNECNGHCILDASDLVDIDASGIQLLVSFRKTAQKNRVTFDIVHYHQEMEKTFQKLGLGTMLVKENV